MERQKKPLNFARRYLLKPQMMKFFKKRYIFYAVIVVLAAILYSPIRSCVRMYKTYYKFGATIHPGSDHIFYEPKTQKTFFPSEFNEQSRLFYLCKIWGFLKYYSVKTSMIPKMDSLLIAAIPQVIETTDKTEYRAILKKLVERVGDFNSTGKNFYSNIDDYILIDNQWTTDTLCLYDGFKADYDTLWTKHSSQNNFAYNKEITGNIRLKNENTYADFPDEHLRLLGLFRYWNVINYFYVYKNHIDKSWDEVLYESIPYFKGSDTKAKYHRAIYQFTNQLRDTHASYPPTIDGVVFGAYRPNFRMLLIDSTFIINQIRVPEYEIGNFKVGDIVLCVDNQEIRALGDSLAQYVCGGNYWSNQSFLCNAILSRRDTNSVFTILRGNDTLQLKSKNYTAYDLHQQQRKQERKNENKRLYKWVNDSIAYFNLRSATYDNFKKNYNPIKSASAIILDLRCYPSTDLIMKLTDAFVPPHSFFAYSTYPDARYPGMVRYMKSTSENIGSKDYYKGKIIVLLNEWTESYSEYITMALQANPNTVTVGNNSSGADGNVTISDFPGNVKSLYSGIGIYYPDFTPTQRIGVKIDYMAEPTIESIKQGIDIAYEKAVELAEK
ncbi:MAG: S41 family peptidase [Dysgonamonadaceae bacterium]|nr:S41 family peptidase [Dysgonamonadaceae bacterium]